MDNLPIRTVCASDLKERLQPVVLYALMLHHQTDSPEVSGEAYLLIGVLLNPLNDFGLYGVTILLDF